MNNIYVDELPKDCGYCPYCFGCEEDGYYCDLDVFYREYDFDGRHPNCPLKSLKDALAEERKKVVQEIRDVVNESQYMGRFNNIDKETLFKVLDQIERGK